jgi:hypothetical protein
MLLKTSIRSRCEADRILDIEGQERDQLAPATGCPSKFIGGVEVTIGSLKLLHNRTLALIMQLLYHAENWIDKSLYCGALVCLPHCSSEPCGHNARFKPDSGIRLR